MELLKKRVRQKWCPYQLYGSPLDIMHTLKYGESSNTKTDAPATNTILQPFYSLDFKSRYGVEQNYSQFITENSLLGEMYQI